jgi:hypothetical protein
MLKRPSCHKTVRRNAVLLDQLTYTLYNDNYQNGIYLKPNKQYEFDLNSSRHTNVRSSYGVPLDPYYYTVKTAKGEDVEAMRPQIISTSPAIGASEVDPALSEITVTFDRDMDMQDFSWFGAESAALSGCFPPVTPNKAPFWRDKRTCVLPVSLAPEKFYRAGINEGKSDYHGFHSVDGIIPPTSAIYFATQEASEEVLERLAKPRLVKAEPANGAQGVDPNITEIRFTFDVEMYPGVYLCKTGPEHALEWSKFPPIRGDTFWMTDQKTLVMPVKLLKPNTEYKLNFNNVSFKRTCSKWGVPLDNTTYTFTTGPERNEEK